MSTCSAYCFIRYSIGNVFNIEIFSKSIIGGSFSYLQTFAEYGLRFDGATPRYACGIPLVVPKGIPPSRYFRIGWNWVKAALLNGWKLLRCVTFFSYKDPNPAMASLKQHQRRESQLEFKVMTYSYNVS